MMGLLIQKETGAKMDMKIASEADLQIKVIKRDGRIMPFSADKIEQAIIKAAKNVKTD